MERRGRGLEVGRWKDRLSGNPTSGYAPGSREWSCTVAAPASRARRLPGSSRERSLRNPRHRKGQISIQRDRDAARGERANDAENFGARSQRWPPQTSSRASRSHPPSSRVIMLSSPSRLPPSLTPRNGPSSSKTTTSCWCAPRTSRLFRRDAVH